jgi:DNA-binding IclR family transcriptional regulator
MVIQKKQSDVGVLVKAVQVIRACDKLGGSLSLADIARETKLPRSTVQRIVTTLAGEGFLTANGKSRSVGLGPDLLALGAADVSDLVERAKFFLERLSQQTGETVDMSRLHKDHAIFINQVTGTHRLQAVSSVGQRFPLHCTSHGKAMLALFDNVDAQRIVGSKLKTYTPKSITSWAALKKELEKIRRVGLAEDNEEHSLGICSVGSAFRVKSGQIFSVSIPIPTIRFNSRKESCIEQLLQCVEDIQGQQKLD